MSSRRPVELVYGKSGTGKTTWWLKLAIHFWHTEQKRTRVWHGMGGAETIQSAIDCGALPAEAIEVMDYTSRAFPAETARNCAQGYWPRDLQDPDSPMEPPTKDDVFGLYVIEGLTQMANFIMGSKEGGLADLASKGQKLGQDTPYIVKQKKVTIGGNPPSHFGICQRAILDNIEESRSLPGWVIWTAHESESGEKETDKLIGPAVAGKALTTKIGGSFGNTVHLDTASKKVTEKDPTTGKDVTVLRPERRAYFTEHYDPDGQTLMKYYANNRAFDISRLPASGYITPPDPLVFYNLLKHAKKVA